MRTMWLGLCLVAGLALGACNNEQEPQSNKTVPAPNPPAEATVAVGSTERLFRHIGDTEALAHAICTEASNQPTLGKAGVAQVVLNRARERHQTIPQVVHGKVANGRSEFSGIKVADRDYRPDDLAEWTACYRVAVDVQAGRIKLPKELERATSYLNPRGSDTRGRCWFEKTQVLLIQVADHFFHDNPRTQSERAWVAHKKLSADCAPARHVPMPKPRPMRHRIERVMVATAH